MARVILVVGSERSGTSTLVGVLRGLGWHVPQPELLANDMNPRGFGEPSWAVKFNAMTLGWANVHISDARPSAWDLIDQRQSSEERVLALTKWLAGAVDGDRDVVVKDPRLTWLYRSWRQAVEDIGAESFTAVMTRQPAETLASKLTVNPARGEAGGLAGWVNTCLRAENVTRGERRAFFSYHGLLDNWESQVGRAYSHWGVDDLTIDSSARARVREFIDPTLFRSRADLDAFEAPDALTNLAVELWNLLDEASASMAPPAKAFESVRARYEDLYRSAEDMVESSFAALKRRTNREVRRLRDELAATRGAEID